MGAFVKTQIDLLAKLNETVSNDASKRSRYVSSLAGPRGPLTLQESMPLSAAAVDEYSSLVPITSPLAASKTKWAQQAIRSHLRDLASQY